MLAVATASHDWVTIPFFVEKDFTVFFLQIVKRRPLFAVPNLLPLDSGDFSIEGD